jgi:hypothetical protein
MRYATVFYPIWPYDRKDLFTELVLQKPSTVIFIENWYVFVRDEKRLSFSRGFCFKKVDSSKLARAGGRRVQRVKFTQAPSQKRRFSVLGARFLTSMEIHPLSEPLAPALKLAIWPNWVKYCIIDGFAVFAIIWSILNIDFLRTPLFFPYHAQANVPIYIHHSHNHSSNHSYSHTGIS